ncbi:MAG: hypothetical protein ACU83V_00670 [Gammaproteobacteria bacterium]
MLISLYPLLKPPFLKKGVFFGRWKMQVTSSKSFTILKWLIELNFYASIMVLIIGCVMSISETNSFFEFNVDLYGALANNLRMILLYLAFTEVFLCLLCFFLSKTQFFMLIGLSLIMMAGSIEVYSTINDIEVDPNFSIFFIYTGLSHGAFGLLAYLLKANHADPKTDFRPSP